MYFRSILVISWLMRSQTVKHTSFFEFRITKSFRKGIKGKIIILLMFGVPGGSTDVINRFRSPENLRNDRNRSKWTPIA